MRDAEEPLRQIEAAARVCRIWSEAGNYEGFKDSAERLISLAKELAKLTKLLKHRSLEAQEQVEEFKAQASEWRERADALEREAESLLKIVREIHRCSISSH